MNRATPESEAESSLLSHLIELRSRLMRGLAGVFVVLLGLLPFTSKLYTWIAEPLIARLPAGQTMIAMDPAGGFIAPVKLAFFVALFVAAPWLLYQAWAFVAPGLYQREKKLALPLLASAVTLFYSGCAFAYFLVLPALFKFVISFTPAVIAVTPDASAYLDFVLVIFIAFGASFELPVALVILVPAGLDHPAAVEGLARLRIGRDLRAGRGDHPAGRGLAAAAGHPHVPAVRSRHRGLEWVTPREAKENT